jgi:simple sugar transport system ATP-binding protein
MKILIGLVTPDSGEIRIGDQPVTITSPQQAADLGIGMVHQHFSLVDALTVWENVILGEGGMRLDRKRARQLVGEIGDQYGLAIDPDATVGNLSAGQRQRIEIIKCLRRNPKILIFDEPTSVLTPDESEMLFRVLRQVVQLEGRTVALVSHKLEEVLHATDDVVIMRDGKLVASMQTSGTKPEELARAMVGREVKLRGATPSSAPAVSAAKTGTPGLKISGLSVACLPMCFQVCVALTSAPSK